jgi:hypothetical protein
MPLPVVSGADCISALGRAGPRLDADANADAGARRRRRARRANYGSGRGLYFHFQAEPALSSSAPFARGHLAEPRGP